VDIVQESIVSTDSHPSTLSSAKTLRQVLACDPTHWRNDLALGRDEDSRTLAQETPGEGSERIFTPVFEGPWTGPCPLTAWHSSAMFY
jgi:hypothetical protein